MNTGEQAPVKQCPGDRLQAEEGEGTLQQRKTHQEALNKGEWFCLQWKLPNSEIKSPHCRKPNPGTSGPYFLWLNSLKGEQRGNRSSVCGLVLAAGPKLSLALTGKGGRPWATGTRSRISSLKAISEAERLVMLCVPTDRRLFLECCSLPMSYHPLRAPSWRW